MCTDRLFSQGADLFALESSPISHSWHERTRDNGLPNGEDRTPLCSLVMTQYQSVTDRRTDGLICYSTCSDCKASFAEHCNKLPVLIY